MAVTQGLRLGRTRFGWRLGIPSGYAAFRSETAYGDASKLPVPQDVVAWLAWCKRNSDLLR